MSATGMAGEWKGDLLKINIVAALRAQRAQSAQIIPALCVLDCFLFVVLTCRGFYRDFGYHDLLELSQLRRSFGGLLLGCFGF